jgi:hypothetical protein
MAACALLPVRTTDPPPGSPVGAVTAARTGVGGRANDPE